MGKFLLIFNVLLLYSHRLILPVMSLSVINGTYTDLTVSLSSSLDQSDCEQLVTKIKETLTATSNSMAVATSGLSFKNITVVVPSNWKTCGKYTLTDANSRVTYASSSIRVGLSHPVFGDAPFTQQPRECGMEGDFIFLSDAWLINSADNRGSRVLQEWAKYRWGVFEEDGHVGDPIYPTSFYSKQDTDYKPNFCSNVPLEGAFDSECEENPDCQFNIDPDENNEVKSSLMALSDLSTVIYFCDSTSHQATTPSKQNVMCNGRSATEIIQEHQDFTQHSRSKISSNADELNLSVVREEMATNVVFAYDVSEYMDEILNRFSFEKEAISQFIMYEAPSSARIGLVSFDSIARIKHQLMRLTTDFVRKNIVQYVLKDKTNDTNQPNLKAALEQASLVMSSKSKKGIIVLITACTLEHPPSNTAAELAIAAGGNIVWVILYPANDVTYLPTFTDLASLTGGQVVYVEDEIVIDGNNDSYISPRIRMELNQAFRQLLHLEEEYDIQQVNYTTCEKDSTYCEATFIIEHDLFKPLQILYMYHDDSVDIDNPSFEIHGGDCLPEDFINYHNIKTTEVLKCNFTNTEYITVSVSKNRKSGILLIEQVGSPAHNDSSYQIVLWASSDIFSLEYTSETAPAIYVQVLYEGRPIIDALVTATVTIPTVVRDIYEPKILNDDGIGADVTGNDGIYSMFLVPVVQYGDFSITISASDNDGNATLTPVQFDSTGGGTVSICCGSKIVLAGNLESTGQFEASRVSIPARVTRTIKTNLPPGIIKDFTAVMLSDNEAQLRFTATGDDLDYGKADKYQITLYNNDTSVQSRASSYQPAPSGTTENIALTNDAPSCGESVTIVIQAVDTSGSSGPPSNKVYLYNPCITPKKLSTGALVGIILGSILIILIILALLYFWFRKEDRHGEKRKGKHSKLNTCACMDGEDSDSMVYQKKTMGNMPSNEDDTYANVEQIRSINDLRISDQKLDDTEMEPQILYAVINDKERNRSQRDLEERFRSNNSLDSHVENLDSTDHSAAAVNRISINQIGVPVLPPLNSDRLPQFNRNANTHQFLHVVEKLNHPPPVPVRRDKELWRTGV